VAACLFKASTTVVYYNAVTSGVNYEADITGFSRNTPKSKSSAISTSQFDLKSWFESAAVKEKNTQVECQPVSEGGDSSELHLSAAT
jgi:hypothetical protein